MRKILAACGLLLAFAQGANAQSLSIRQVATCSVGSFNTPFLTVDTAGTLCTSAGGGGGGGTSSSFGAAYPATGTAAGAKDVSGNMAALNLDASGNLKVTGGGTSATDASAFTTGSTSIVPMGGLYNDAATLTSGQVGAPRMTTKRAQIVDVDTSGNALYSALTSSIPAGTNLIGKVGVDQTTNGTTNGVSIVGVNSATALAGNGASGTGAQRVTISNDNTGIANWGQGATAATAPTGATQVAGTAQNAEATAVTNGQLKAFVTDLVGKQIMLPYANPENFLNGLITTAMTGTTDIAVTGMGAQGAGVRVYVTGCVISNSSASVGTDVVLKDGSGGSVLWTFPAATNYGGTAFTFPTPIKTTANTALFAANITTGSSTKVSCTGYKGI